MREQTVLGERCGDLFEEIVGLDFTFPPAELAHVEGRVHLQGALMRAFHRAEAKLLIADAGAMRKGTYVFRTPEQRRADAFALVLTTFTRAVDVRIRAASTATGQHRPAGKQKRSRRTTQARRTRSR
jgi:hypothetical protein